MSSSQLDVFLGQLSKALGGGYRARTRSQFNGFIKAAWDRLDAEDSNYPYLDGRTRNRAEGS